MTHKTTSLKTLKYGNIKYFKILYFVHISLHKKIFPFTKIHELLDNNHRNSEYKLKNSSLKLRSFFGIKKFLTVFRIIVVIFVIASISILPFPGIRSFRSYNRYFTFSMYQRIAISEKWLPFFCRTEII